MRPLPKYILSLDVETVGLYGQPFAWAAIIREAKPGGRIVTETICVCPFDAAMGTEDDREWCRANVLPAMRGKIELAVDAGMPVSLEAGNVDELLEKFVDFWAHWSKEGTWILVDHGYPVEAEFLFMAFMIAFAVKKDFEAPYSVLDYASMKYGALGEDPTASEPRFSSEQPAHHPLLDARQTLRLAWPLILGEETSEAPRPIAKVHDSGD